MPFLPKELEAAEEALSRLLQIGVALALEGLSDTLPDIQEPFSLLHQGKAADNTAGLLAWKTDGPRSKTDYCWWPSRLRSLVFTAQ